MTEERLPLTELLQKAEDGDFLRSVAEAVLQLLMEADLEGLIGAGRHERSPERLNYRNGFRDRTLDTRLGSLQLRIPKLRQGSLDALRGSSPFVLGAAQDQRKGRQSGATPVEGHDQRRATPSATGDMGSIVASGVGAAPQARTGRRP
jgi:hypothetical protein